MYGHIRCLYTVLANSSTKPNTTTPHGARLWFGISRVGQNHIYIYGVHIYGVYMVFLAGR